MINVRVTTKKARELIGEIPHGICQTGSQKYWVEGGTAGVTAQRSGAYWLMEKT